MDRCCGDLSQPVESLRSGQIVALKAVCWINAVMFVAELGAGLTLQSSSLVSDSLDMLGDALAYGLSLYVVRRSGRWKALSAMMKGGLMTALGASAFGHAVFRAWGSPRPDVAAMGLVGLCALVANAICLGILWRHRSEDINMRSVWLCSLNDILAGVSVVAAAGGVWLTRSRWPDVVVGAAVALFVLRSGLAVLWRARAEWAASPSTG